MSRNPSYRMKRARNVAAATLVLTGCLPVAFAQDTASTGNSGALETVVVTATKRSEDLQVVPVAVSAITSTELENRGIAETSDLMGSLPNLQVTSAYGKTQPNFSLRGISVANEFSAATASPVGVYVDEVYQSFRASHGQQLFDLEQVEVLRGPQGTLFGRNTTGGAISFTTRKPSLGETDAYVSAGYGRFEATDANGAIEFTPVTDVFGIRVAGTITQADGYTFNPVDGKDYAETDSRAARLSARFKPTDQLDVNFKVFWAKNDALQDLPYGFGYLNGDPNAPNQSASGYTRDSMVRVGADRSRAQGRFLNEDEIESDGAGTYFTETEGASLTLDYELNDSVSFSSITGFDNSKFSLSPFDCDGSPIDLCAIRYNSDSDNFNQEFRVTFTTDKVKVIGGIYYGVDEIDTFNQPDFFGFANPDNLALPLETVPIALAGETVKTIPAFAAPGATVGPLDPGGCAPVETGVPGAFLDARTLIALTMVDFPTNQTGGLGAATLACLQQGAPLFQGINVDQRFTIERPSTAIYGEAKYSFTDSQSLTLGLRFTQDDVKYKNASSVNLDAQGNVLGTLVPVSNQFTNPPFDGTIATVNTQEETSEFTGRLIYDLKVTDSIFTYASYSHGYRAGTYNALAYQSPSQVIFLEPETVDAFEVGIKSRFFNNRAQLNAAVFYYDYKNQQVAEIVGATSFLRSANGEVKGFEAEAIAQVLPRLRVDLSLGLLDTRYDDNQRFSPTGLDIGGNEFPNAPDVTANLGFDVNIWENSFGAVSFRGDVQYMGRYFFDPFNDYGDNVDDVTGLPLATKQLAGGNPSYTLVNARLSYDTDKFSVGAWAKNLTDKFYFVYGLNLMAFSQDYFTRGAPRTYGIDGTYRF